MRGQGLNVLAWIGLLVVGIPVVLIVLGTLVFIGMANPLLGIGLLVMLVIVSVNRYRNNRWWGR